MNDRSCRRIHIVAVLTAALLLVAPSALAQPAEPAGPAQASQRRQRTATPVPAPAPMLIRGNKPGEVYYTVQRGDTFWLIARRFGVTVDAVKTNNGFDGKKVLREGMRLHLPYSNEMGSVSLQGDIPIVKGAGLHLVARIQRQTCWLFRDGKLEQRWTCSTGRPGSPSIPGNYTVQTKMPRAYNGAAEFWMPSWLGIYEAGQWENGIHGIPYRATNGERLWTELVGTPITYGCVMLEDRVARSLYEMAYIGMPVTILD